MVQASTSPLVGRAEQLAVLREAAARATRGQPVVVLVQGEAGIGKTRLVGELLARLSTGWTVARGACSEAAGRTLPFAPWIEVLRDLDGRVDSDVVDLLVPREASPAGTPVSTGRLYGAISDGLLTAARRTPIVVVVEDVHWSDGASRDVTEFVSRAMRSQRLLLVVTARTDDPAYATVRPLLAELERIDHSLSVHLERLPPQHVETMARALGAHDWSADQVAARTGRSSRAPTPARSGLPVASTSCSAPAPRPPHGTPRSRPWSAPSCCAVRAPTERKPGARRWHGGVRPACPSGWPARCWGRDGPPASG